MTVLQIEREPIRSRQNQNLVSLCKLADRKTREENREFRFDGIKLLEEAVRNHIEIKSVFVRSSTSEKIISRLQNCLKNEKNATVGKIMVVEDTLFDRISEEKSPDGAITIAKYIDKFQKIVTIYNSDDFFEMRNESVVLLESVRDPSNIGAIIRSAAAIGVDRLILSADCADIYHPKAVRASMGTLFNQRIDRVSTLIPVIHGLADNGRRVFAAALRDSAMSLGTFARRAGDCIVIGNEGHGLSESTIAACTHSVMIPMSGRAESFNAAVAASLLMWEFAKHDGR